MLNRLEQVTVPMSARVLAAAFLLASALPLVRTSAQDSLIQADLSELSDMTAPSGSSIQATIHLSDAEPVPAPAPLPLPAPPTLDPELIPTSPRSNVGTIESLVEDGEPECAPRHPYQEFFYWGSGRMERGSWLIGKGDRMGLFSLPVLLTEVSQSDGITIRPEGMIHFISGPQQVDLPPRVYEFTVAASRRAYLSERWSYDVSFRVGWFTDFEGSARNGVRFPSHGVAYFRQNECVQWLLGVDYLDRDDVRILPVCGFLWTPGDAWRIEAVFPKPQIACRVNNNWLSVGAEMGGSSFDIKRDSGTKDVATYRDFRLFFSIQQADADADGRALEIGYVFDRHLEYRSGTPDFEPLDTIAIRSVFCY